MPPKARPQDSRDSVGSGTRAGSVAAGGGAGGAIIFLINGYTKPPIQDLLLYAAPTVAIGISAIYVAIIRRINRAMADRELQRELNNAKARLKAIEADPKSTEAHKAGARKQVEALELLVMNVHSRRIEAIIEEN